MEDQQNNKNIAVLSCLSIVMIFVSFTAGILGSYIGNQLLTITGAPGTQDAIEQQRLVISESSVIDVVDQNDEAVVSVIVTRELTRLERQLAQRFGSEDNGSETVGSGSGFIVSEDGMIITNRHVVNDSSANYTVILNDGTEYAAEVLARDTVLDIAVIKIDPEDRELTVVQLGDSELLRVGQHVIAIGNSLGQFSGSVSYGIVSGLSRSIVASDGLGRNQERLDGVIQTDASINPGNSGGPLFDLAGNVVGVNVAVARDAENIGFAIPINVVKRIIDDVMEFGEIRRPYLGVRYRTVTDAVQQELELSENYGALVVAGPEGEPAVIEGSPAAEAGFKEGDHILSVNGKDISETHSLQKAIQDQKVGDTVEIEFIRDGELQFTQVTLQLAQ